MWLCLGLVGLVVLLGALALSMGSAQKNPPPAEVNPPTTEARLLGRWQRPDGGYVIDIRGVERGGKLDAGYFNPNPIHVAQADWKSDGGALAVFIELRDVNYPGATYRLGYVPETDSLRGEYHQPLVGETFDVEFARIP